WIFLAQRAGRGVARIDVFLPAGRSGARLQRLELGISHVDLAANFDGAGPARTLQLLRDVLDGAEVGGDVLPHRAIAARGTLDEHAVLVAQRGREAVDLWLGGEGEFEVLVALEEAA